jgi:anti-anti-sigma factor
MCDQVFQVTLHHINQNSLIFDFCGNLNASFTKHLSDLSRQIPTTTAHHVIFNLSGIEHIDGSGLKALLMFCVFLRKRDCRIAAYGLNDELKQVFSLARLNAILRLFIDEPQALGWMSS